MDIEEIKKHFTSESRSWIESAYQSDGYTFPTGLARLSKAIALLGEEFPNRGSRVADLGCGGGQLCIRLAEGGFFAIGVDASETMISNARQASRLTSQEAQSRIRFERRDLLSNGLETGVYDAVTSLGVIGYLPDDDALFEQVARLLRPGGLFIVSCRNRLFNMVSPGDYTLREIERGDAPKLLLEICDLLQPVPPQDASNLVEALAAAASSLTSETIMESTSQLPLHEPRIPSAVEARQHTPSGLRASAARRGLKCEGLYGVHPHLMIAGVNRLLPPHVFNRLSAALDTLDRLPVSLIWSSVFIGVFRKVDG